MLETVSADREKPLKIAFVVDTFLPAMDGVINVVLNLCKELHRKLEIYVIAPHLNKELKVEQKDCYKIICVRGKKRPFLFRLSIDSRYINAMPRKTKGFDALLDKIGFDIIHIHSPMLLGGYMAKYANNRGILLLGTLHSQYRDDIKRVAKLDLITNIVLSKIAKTFSRCNTVFTVNQRMVDVGKNYGIKTNFEVIGNATDLEVHLSKKNNSVIAKKYNFSDKEKNLIFVGRIVKTKNIIFLVESLKVLKEKYLPFKMRFVGDGLDLGLLEKRIKQLDLEDNVTLLGLVKKRADIASLFALSDLFVFPSLYDTDSLVQIEAAAAGTPTAFLAGSVTSSSITHDLNGFLIDACDNPQKFGEELYKILTDEEKLKKAAQGAKETLQKNWEQVAETLYNKYFEKLTNE